MQFQEILAVAATTLTLLPFFLGSANGQACGAVALTQNFDKYSGALKPYTKEEAKQDFGAGFVFGQGYERASVGDGALRSAHPAGAALVQVAS
jgi:hypothetical protein